MKMKVDVRKSASLNSGVIFHRVPHELFSMAGRARQATQHRAKYHINVGFLVASKQGRGCYVNRFLLGRINLCSCRVWTFWG